MKRIFERPFVLPFKVRRNFYRKKPFDFLLNYSAVDVNLHETYSWKIKSSCFVHQLMRLAKFRVDNVNHRRIYQPFRCCQLFMMKFFFLFVGETGVILSMG